MSGNDGGNGKRSSGTATTRRAAWAALRSGVLVSMAAFSACQGVPPPPPPVMTDRASVEATVAEAITQRRFRAALALVDEQLASAPGDAGWLDQKTALLRHLGREREALALVTRRREQAPSDAALAYESGELQTHLGERGKARADFAAAAALAPDESRPALALAALDLSQDPPDLAAAAARVAPWLDGATPSAEAWFQQGFIDECNGTAASARLRYARAVDLDPAHVGALVNAARLDAANGDRLSARRLLVRARVAAGDDAARRARIEAAARRIESLE